LWLEVNQILLILMGISGIVGLYACLPAGSTAVAEELIAK
jgi:hypothetical protein